MTSLKRMIEIAKEIEQADKELAFSLDSDKIHSIYPELSLHQAVLIDCYIVERVLGLQAMTEALQEFSKIATQK